MSCSLDCGVSMGGVSARKQFRCPSQYACFYSFSDKVFRVLGKSSRIGRSGFRNLTDVSIQQCGDVPHAWRKEFRFHVVVSHCATQQRPPKRVQKHSDCCGLANSQAIQSGCFTTLKVLKKPRKGCAPVRKTFATVEKVL